MASIIDKFGKWAASRPAWVASAFHRLTAEGRSETRAKKITSLIERAGFEEFRPVPGSKGARYFLPGAPKTTPTISRNIYIKKRHGLSPTKLAAARKAGERGYKTAASEEQAKKTIATRKFSRRFRRADKFQNEEHEHTFVDRNGRWTSELFRGRDLAIMQEYRGDWQQALKFNDASLLERYKKMIIRNTSGEQVFPATDLKIIRNFLDGLSTRMRNRFEREVNYLTRRDALAA